MSIATIGNRELVLGAWCSGSLMQTLSLVFESNLKDCHHSVLSAETAEQTDSWSVFDAISVCVCVIVYVCVCDYSITALYTRCCRQSRSDVTHIFHAHAACTYRVVGVIRNGFRFLLHAKRVNLHPLISGLHCQKAVGASQLVSQMILKASC